MRRIAAAEGDLAIGAGDGLLDQRRWKAQPAVGAQLGAGGGQRGNAAGRRIGQADGFEQLQRGRVDAAHLRFGQRAKGAAGQAGADRAQVVGELGGTGSTARGAAAHAGGFRVCLVVHLWLRRKGKGSGLRPGPACRARHDPGLRRWSCK